MKKVKFICSQKVFYSYTLEFSDEVKEEELQFVPLMHCDEISTVQVKIFDYKMPKIKKIILKKDIL